MPDPDNKKDDVIRSVDDLKNVLKDTAFKDVPIFEIESPRDLKKIGESGVFQGKVELDFSDQTIIISRGKISIVVPYNEIEDLVKFVSAAAELLK